MKTDRREAADIVRRLDDAATRAKRDRGLNALKDWDTAEFDGFSGQPSSGLEQLRHWDAVPDSQVIPLTPLPLKDVPALTDGKAIDSTLNPSPIHRSLLPSSATKPTIDKSALEENSRISLSLKTATPLDNSSVNSVQAQSSVQSLPIPSSVSAVPAEASSSLVSLSKQDVEPTLPPAVRLSGALGMALTRSSAPLSASGDASVSSEDPQRFSKGRGLRSDRRGTPREPRLVVKPRSNRPVLTAPTDATTDFTPAQRAGINAGISIGTGLALAAVTIWLLVWFVSQSMSMVMDSLRAFVQ